MYFIIDVTLTGTLTPGLRGMVAMKGYSPIYKAQKRHQSILTID